MKNMSEIGKIKLRDICDLTANCCNVFISQEVSLQTEATTDTDNVLKVPETPTATPKKRIKKTVSATTSRKKPLEESVGVSAIKTETFGITTTAKKTSKGLRLLPGQQRIDGIFKSCVKTYKIEPEPVSKGEKDSKTPAKRARGRRKRLFKQPTNLSESDTTISDDSFVAQLTPPQSHSKRGTRKKVTNGKNNDAVMDLVIILSSEDENEDHSQVSMPVKRSPAKKSKKKAQNLQHNSIKAKSAKTTKRTKSADMAKGSSASANVLPSRKRRATSKTSSTCATKKEIIPDAIAMVSIPVASTSTTPMKSNTIASPKSSAKYLDSIENEAPFPVSLPTPSQSGSGDTKLPSETFSTSAMHAAIPTAPPALANEKGKNGRKKRLCPAYKVVAGTTFAVDAFQYGQIMSVSHYFLTHYHADHYVGLTRKFAMPLYLSPITARLVRAFIKVEDKYINEIDLNRPEVIAGVEVTAIDANHCPGAVMFVFKLSTGKCILHTGDFRACPQMESEPIFWNNWIDTIYLDTTYISSKYNICAQSESIDNAISIVKNFFEKRAPARILLVCGAYVIGKEKFWTALAQHFKCRVWTEKNRSLALHVMDLVEVRDLLCDNPLQAQLHVISIGKLSYLSLDEYFKPFEKHFDALLAIRPSGWEKHSRPQLRGRINIVGIEYSEHSSCDELQRFVTYLKPNEVISTVPVANNPMITAKIPEKWYKYGKLSGRRRNFQASITSYIKMRPIKKANKCKTQNCISPTKATNERSYDSSQLSMQPMENCFEVDENEQPLTVVDTSTHVSGMPAIDIAETKADSNDTVKLDKTIFKQSVAVKAENVECSERVFDADTDANDDWMP